MEYLPVGGGIIAAAVVGGVIRAIRMRRPGQGDPSVAPSDSVVVDDPDPILRAVVEECWRTGEDVFWKEGDPIPGTDAEAPAGEGR